MKKQTAYLLFGILITIILSCNSAKVNEVKKVENSQNLISNTKFSSNLSEVIEKDNEIKNSNLKVELIDYCNVRVGCGTMAFASSNIVKILEGKFKNDTIVVAELCREINYTRKKIYRLKYETAPNFGVSMCYGNMYNADYNTKAENKFYVAFGSLTENSIEKY